MVVVDAGLVVALLVPDPRQAIVARQFRTWLNADVQLHAPAVLPYEVLNVLARQVWDKQLAPDRAGACWMDLRQLDLAVHAFDDLSDGPRALAVAQRLGRRHATDCAYVALAERLGAEVWTIDQPLARAAQSAGMPVHLLE